MAICRNRHKMIINSLSCWVLALCLRQVKQISDSESPCTFFNEMPIWASRRLGQCHRQNSKNFKMDFPNYLFSNCRCLL